LRSRAGAGALAAARTSPAQSEWPGPGDSAASEARLIRMEAIAVRRSPRARRWRLEVRWGEPARLTVPRWMSRAEVEQVLEEKRRWLEAQRRAQVPRLGLERRAVSESEARVAARELVSALAEEEA